MRNTVADKAIPAPGGGTMLVGAPGTRPTLDLTYHGVSIELGMGAAPTIARTIFWSLRFIR